MADPNETPSTISDESREGFELIRRLLQERAALVEEAKDLHARYGPYGTFAVQREIFRCRLAAEYRDSMAGRERITQTMVDEAVNADREFIEFIANAERERARLYVYYDRIKALTQQINWLTFSAGRLLAMPDAAPESALAAEDIEGSEPAGM